MAALDYDCSRPHKGAWRFHYLLSFSTNTYRCFTNCKRKFVLLWSSRFFWWSDHGPVFWWSDMRSSTVFIIYNVECCFCWHCRKINQNSTSHLNTFSTWTNLILASTRSTTVWSRWGSPSPTTLSAGWRSLALRVSRKSSPPSTSVTASETASYSSTTVDPNL